MDEEFELIKPLLVVILLVFVLICVNRLLVRLLYVIFFMFPALSSKTYKSSFAGVVKATCLEMTSEMVVPDTPIASPPV